MSFRAAGSRAHSMSRSGVENHGRGVKLGVTTQFDEDGKIKKQLNGDASTFKPARHPSSYLHIGSTPDKDAPLIVSSSAAKQPAYKAKVAPIGTHNGISPTREKVFFTTDVVPGVFVGSHYMKIVVAKNMYNDLFDALNQEFDWNKLVRIFFLDTESDDKKFNAYALFDDVNRAGTVQESVNMIDTTADVSYVSQSEFDAAHKHFAAKQPGDSTTASTLYDGQVMVYAKIDGPVTASRTDGLEDRVRALLEKYGDVLALGELDAKDGMARFRAEFSSIKAAKEMAKKVTADSPADLGGWLVFVTELADTMTASSDKSTGTAGRGTPDSSALRVSPTGRTTWVQDAETGKMRPVSNNGSDRASPVNGGAMIMHPNHRWPSPTAAFGFGPQQLDFRHSPVVGMHSFNFSGNSQGNQQYGRARKESTDNNQTVDPDNIRAGIDVRTTIMLRNLPNQFTCHKLKELLDASNFGEYDFTYVRIDYEKGASVGYGFVNFSNPMAIIVFIYHHLGRPWMPELPNRRGAARLAEISYATVQGYDCCVEKFRNSSVMTECPDYRPKLWYSKETTDNPAYVGTEREFPEVNNPSKHQRSLANAQQIGLFPPQSRRGPDGHHRSVRSQWDRGTTAQVQEDAAFRMQQQMAMMQFGNTAPMAAGPSNQMVPYGMMQPMAPFQNGGGFDGFGNPVFGNGMPMMPVQNAYHQQPNFNGFAGPHMNGNGYTNGGMNNGYGNTIPRTFSRANRQQDVNVATLTGYHDPTYEKVRREIEADRTGRPQKQQPRK